MPFYSLLVTSAQSAPVSLNNWLTGRVRLPPPPLFTEGETKALGKCSGHGPTMTRSGPPLHEGVWFSHLPTNADFGIRGEVRLTVPALHGGCLPGTHTGGHTWCPQVSVRSTFIWKAMGNP